MKKNYRFHIDLRPKAPPPPAEAMVLNEAIRREQAWQARLEAIGPAWLDAEAYEDPLTAMEHLEAYNASLVRAQQLSVGAYQEGGVQYEVFFESPGYKGILSQVVDRPSSRISQLTLSPEGDLTRLSLEHKEGASQDLRSLFRSGLASLSSDDLAFYQGYLWICLAYTREEERLVRVTQTSRICRVDSGRVEFSEEVLID